MPPYVATPETVGGPNEVGSVMAQVTMKVQTPLEVVMASDIRPTTGQIWPRGNPT